MGLQIQPRTGPGTIRRSDAQAGLPRAESSVKLHNSGVDGGGIGFHCSQVLTGFSTLKCGDTPQAHPKPRRW